MAEIQQDVTPEVSIPTPAMDPMPEYTPETETKAVTGPVVAILVVLVALFLGGLYLWASRLPEEESFEQQTTLENKVENNVKTTPGNKGTTSDEISDLEKELSGDLSSTEKDFSEIDAALKTDI